jgi:glutamate-5-semialdehyde dehydrogenase
MTDAATDGIADCVELARRSKAASRALLRADTAQKNRFLLRLAEELVARSAAVLAANAEDVAAARARGLAEALVDRLTLSEARIAALSDAVRSIAALPDPVGEVVGMHRRPSGITVGKVRAPLGVILMIYESRPNVTVDAAALCVKAGNAAILRGGSEALRSNLALSAIVQDALAAEALPRDAVQVVASPERQLLVELLKLEEYIDLAIPRGGEGLIRFVAGHARVPVIKHYKGVCHVFVDASADLAMALDIAENAKVQRPGVCNAMETLLVHRAVATELLPRLAARLPQVELRGDETVCTLIPRARPASEDDWSAEYLDLILSVRVVEDFEAALSHIARYGSLHTEAIVTSDYANSQRFLKEVDASCVLVNASTRFNDGGELGLGAEIGISTSKMHAFGPMGLVELTTQKYIVYGDGQVRK